MSHETDFRSSLGTSAQARSALRALPAEGCLKPRDGRPEDLEIKALELLSVRSAASLDYDPTVQRRWMVQTFFNSVDHERPSQYLFSSDGDR
jgi:hypothetical protein